MAVRFTDEQKLAIETLDRSVLVSAAAGSGKTAILVERILRIILEGRADVDELLVVTFTRAAAAEMKSRLASAIRKRMREEPAEAARLKDQLSRLYRASIQTIDSFAISVVREFFYETDNGPGIRMLDDVQGELLKREAASELLEEGFDRDDFIGGGEVGFREFMRLYSDEKSDDGFRENLILTYDKLRSIPDYFEWAAGRADDLNVTRETFAGSGISRAIFADVRETLDRACRAAAKVRVMLIDAGLEDEYNDKLAPEQEMMAGLRERIFAGESSADILDELAEVTFPTFSVTKKGRKELYAPVKDDVRALRDGYKKEIQALQARYTLPDLDTRIREMSETSRYTAYYIRLLEEFERRFEEKKSERGVMDFADAEHTAVRILRDPANADILRRRYKYIFVDEYQDTNRIQEELISSVSRHDNVFRVGDVKQSIYKFRQAEPELFEDIYRRFSEPGSNEGLAIDLGMNFRSNDATVRYINRVFSEIMDGYDERAMLRTGAECKAEYDFVPEVHVLTGAGSDEPDEDDDAPDIDEETGRLSKEEAEAEYIARLVESIIGTKYEDTKTHEIRTAEPGDIAVLFRSVKARGEIISAALRKRGIEPYVEASEDYFDTVEISIAMSLLSCIDNMKRDIPLIATLHSGVFGWTASELAEVRIAHNEHLNEERLARAERGDEERKTYHRAAYYEALSWYREDGPDGALRDKAVYAYDRLLEWRRMSRMMALDDFVWHVLVDSGCYRLPGAMHGGARRQANLRTLADRAGKFSKENVASLSSYISFVEVMKQRKIHTGETPSAGGRGAVCISTIHKSKGLEYPFVIVGGLGHRFTGDRGGRTLSFDPSIGIGLPYIDPSRKYWRSTLVQKAISAKSGRDSYSEELRVLYVAMTRARNRLILTGTCDSEEKLMQYTAHPDSYLKAMRDVIRTASNRYYISPLDLTAAKIKRRRLSIPDPAGIVLDENEQQIFAEIDRRFTYEYPGRDLLTSKAKYSVSELRRAALEGEDRPAHLRRPESKVSAAEVGTGYHRIMEMADFARAVKPDGTSDAGYIRETANLLRRKGAIREEVFTEIDPGRIEKFFSSDIGRRAAEAAKRGALRKEKAFTLRTTIPGEEGRTVLVQGVIDCCFEEDGRMILVDYKSGYIMQGRRHEEDLLRVRQEYMPQIELYAEAVRKGTGMEVSEAYLYLFSTGELLDMM